MAKQGRPRGLNVNPAAVEHLLLRQSWTKKELCEAVGITQGHLSDMLRRGKGASPLVIRRMADALICEQAVIAPELTGRFRSIRPGDPEGGGE